MEKLVDDVIDALPDWDDIRNEAEKAAAAVGDWAGNASKSLQRRDEQTTWFVLGGISVLAIIFGLAWWRRNRRTAEEA